MELVYLWVEEYQCLKDVEFNFGGEHIFHYDKNKNELTSEKNPQYVEGFFNVDPDRNTKISNVTAIVGENGAGKSTAINVIDETILNHFSNFTPASKFLCVYKERDQYQLLDYYTYANYDEKLLEKNTTIQANHLTLKSHIFYSNIIK